MSFKSLVYDILTLMLVVTLWLNALVTESPIWFVLAFVASIGILLVNCWRAMKE